VIQVDNDKDKKDNYLLDEIISPIFGHEYKDRVIENKNLVPHVTQDIKETNYLEKQIEEELEAKNKIAKVKAYEESSKTNTDVLKQYQKEKEAKELQAALPSNYLNFRDSLEKTTDDLSIISDFTANYTETMSNSVLEVVDDIFSN